MKTGRRYPKELVICFLLLQGLCGPAQSADTNPKGENPAQADAHDTNRESLAQFDGRVMTARGTPAMGVEVEVNGKRARTGAKGEYLLKTPKSARYVMNVRGQGFALWSQIFLSPMSNGRAVLVRASRHQINPKRQVIVRDIRHSEDCPGPSTKPKNVQSTNCGPGVEVRIPPNSLVDANGQAPKGNVVVSLATYDIQAPQQMPGDRLVAGPRGNLPIGVMTSFGAVYVDIYVGNKKYNLRKGAQAEVRIPIYPGKREPGSNVPPTIPILNYDETTGLWRQMGEGARDGAYYIARVSYFSPINADQVGSPWACIKVDAAGEVIGSDNPANMRLEIRVGASSTASISDTVFTTVIPDFMGPNLPPYVIYAVLPGQYVTITPFNDATNLQVGSSVQVQVSAAQSPQLPNPPDPAYDACADTAFIGFSWQ